MTDNHNYETPQKGATEWHESLNRNFRYIDRDIEIRDVDAAKTDYRPKSGAKFLATDTENVYVGDGSQWLRLATSGQNPSFDTVSAKTIVDRNSGNGYSVDQLAGGSEGGGVEPAVDAVVTLEGGTPTAYWADGSEISQSSDAGVVMNDAIDDVASNSGGTIHVASGTYVSKSKVRVQSNVTVRGAGIGNTVYQAAEAGKGWVSSGSPPENITIRDLTVDGDLQGHRTGINLVNAVDSLIQNVEVKNAGGTDENPDTTPSLRVTGGLRSNIVNCHVENSNAVSIEAAIGAKDCSIINCSITKGRREGDAGFLHGYSIEKSDSCAILGCTADSSNESEFNSFRPALNANNANRAVVANNRVRGASGGLFNVNGDCFDNTYIGNTFTDIASTAVSIGQGNAGVAHGTVLANNVFDGGKVVVGARDSIVRNNILHDAFFLLDSPQNGASIIGNHFYDIGDNGGPIARIEDTGDGSPVLFANNYLQREESSRNTTPMTRFIADYGIMTGNVFGLYGGGSPERACANLEDGTRWLVSGNYFRGPDAETYGLKMCGGRMSCNVFEGADKIVGSNGDETLVIEDNDHLRSSSQWSIKNGSGGQVYIIGEPRMGTYTGDGTTGRFIETFTNPEHVIIKDGSGEVYDVHTAFGVGFEHKIPTGELAITDGGFTIGSNGGDAGANISGEDYIFYAR